MTRRVPWHPACPTPGQPLRPSVRRPGNRDHRVQRMPHDPHGQALARRVDGWTHPGPHDASKIAIAIFQLCRISAFSCIKPSQKVEILHISISAKTVIGDALVPAETTAHRGRGVKRLRRPPPPLSTSLRPAPGPSNHSRPKFPAGSLPPHSPGFARRHRSTPALPASARTPQLRAFDAEWWCCASTTRLELHGSGEVGRTR